MRAELLMIGTELLLGQITDTNAARMARVLAEHGVPLYQKSTVGDNESRILAAMRTALERADVVLCSGGLGPTEDDITRECAARVAGVELEFHQVLWEQLSAWYLRMRRSIPENNRKQAMLPKGAMPLENPVGTAPGFLLEVDRPGGAGTGYLACMPGVPHELDAMLADKILPFLQARFGIRQVVHSRILKVCGLGESRVDSLIGDIIRRQDNPSIGLLASPDVTRIRIAARAENKIAAMDLIAPVEKEVRARLQGRVMGVDDDTLEGVVDTLLCERGWKIAIVDSASGGQVAQRLLSVNAASFLQAHLFSPGAGKEPRDKFVDLVREQLLYLPGNCLLALEPDEAHEGAHGRFECPGGTVEWTSRGDCCNTRNQLRHAVHALEMLRCHLTGVPFRLEAAGTQ